MKYELKKLFMSRYAVLLCISLLLVNGLLFYRRCTGTADNYSLQQVQQKYALGSAIEDERDALEAWAESYWVAQTEPPEGLLTGEPFYELQLDEYICEQRQSVLSYARYLQDKVGEINARLNAGFLGTEENFLYRAQECVMEKYQTLTGLAPRPAFYDQIGLLAEWMPTDLFLFAFVFVGGLLIFSDDRRFGRMLFLRPTVKGRSALFCRKLAALLTHSLAAFFLLYATNIAICGALFGFSDLSLPIQSVPGFLACPTPFTVLGYLINAALDKLLWLFQLVALIALIDAATNGPVGASALCVLAAALSLLLSKLNSPWLAELSLIRQSLTADRYQECFMLSFFGVPMMQTLAFRLVSIGGALTFTAAGLGCFCRRDAVIPSRRRLPRLPVGRHTSLWRHESFKLFVTQKGACWLAVLITVQCAVYFGTQSPVTETEYYLRQYAQVLSGERTDEKDKFLRAEEQRFTEQREKIDFYYSISEDPALADVLTEELRMALRAENAFEIARSQYESLYPGQSYVHSTGYRYLFDASGVQTDLQCLLLMELVLIMSLAGCFATEKENGVSVLQVTAGARGRAARRKLLLALLLALLSLVTAFLPQTLLAAQQYGLTQCGALANSLQIFSGVPESWRIWHIFLMTWSLRALIAGLSVGLILFLSEKTGSLTVTMLVSLIVLAIPPMIGLLMI